MTKLSRLGVVKIAPYALSFAGAVPAIVGASPATAVVPVRPVEPQRVSHALSIADALYKPSTSSSILFNETEAGERFSGTVLVFVHNDSYEDEYEEVADLVFRDASDWKEVRAEVSYSNERSTISIEPSDQDWEV